VASDAILIQDRPDIPAEFDCIRRSPMTNRDQEWASHYCPYRRHGKGSDFPLITLGAGLDQNSPFLPGTDLSLV
jgi:hypothetical protein